jgi:hypothetical protein
VLGERDLASADFVCCSSCFSCLHLAVDTTCYSEPASASDTQSRIARTISPGARAAVRFDEWVPFSIDVKRTYGSYGFTKVVTAPRPSSTGLGPSLPSGQSPKLQFGYYAVRQLRNEVWFAEVRNEVRTFQSLTLQDGRWRAVLRDDDRFW